MQANWRKMVVAGVIAYLDRRCPQTGGDPPRVLLLGDVDRDDVRGLYAALGEVASVTVPRALSSTDQRPLALILCLELPDIGHETAAQTFVDSLAARTDTLLLAPLDVLADPAGQTEVLWRWLARFARSGWLYDVEAPPELAPLGAVLLRRTAWQSADALGYLSLALQARNREIDALRRLADDQDSRYAQLTSLAVRLEEQIRQARAEVTQVESHYRARLEEWEHLRTTPGYALLQALQRLRARFVPPGTLRERLLTMLSGWLRIASARGVAGLAQHLRGELHWRWTAATRRLGRRRRYRNEFVEIQPIPARPPIQPHGAAVDIVVCVHNALEDVQCCLEALERHTRPPRSLILVDDGSDPPTQRFLAEFARSRAWVTLLRNEEAQGYTRAANRGLRQSRADYVVLLNSDTIVSESWLDRMIACAESDARIGLVGPLSNTASYQSVPAVSVGDDWAENPLPPDFDIDTWAQCVAGHSARLYPPMPLLNGFCLLMRREVIEAIGLFDEERYGAGYGEENDYGLRARAAGWRLALADDVYVHHAQSRSYSHARRRQLSARAARLLEESYGRARMEESEGYLREAPVLQGIRARVAVNAERARLIEQGRRRFAGRRLLFLLPADAPGGGASVVISEAEAMQRMDVGVHLFNLRAHRHLFEQSYPRLQLPAHYGDPEDVTRLGRPFDAVVATWHASVPWLAGLEDGGEGPVLGYYVQDFEPHFFEAGSAARRRAIASYTAVPGLCCFTKTAWNRQEVLDNTGVECAVVGPSVDVDRFCPRSQGLSPGESPLRVTAMIRPNSPRRSPRLTMALLRRLSHRYGSRVAITLFGVDRSDPGFAVLPQDFDWRLAGVIDPDRVAALLSLTHVFVDFSTYQAMGLTALEAMASGAAVIVPGHGGSGSFARHGENALVVDTRSEEACWRTLLSLVEDDHLRRRLQRRAIADACRLYPERAAFSILETLFRRRG